MEFACIKEKAQGDDDWSEVGDCSFTRMQMYAYICLHVHASRAEMSGVALELFSEPLVTR